MLGNLRHTFKQTAIYSIGNLSTKIIGLLLLPIYTSRLTTADYGVLAYLETTSLFIVTVLSLGLPTGILRYCTSDKKKYDKEIIFTVYIFSFFASLLILAPLFLFRVKLAGILLEDTSDILLINLLLVIIPLEIINALTLSVIRLREKSGFYVVLVVTRFTVSLLLNIYFIVFKQMKVEGIMLSQLISSLIVILISLFLLVKNITFKFRLDILKDMLKYSFPLIFSTLSSMILTLSDRYIIEYFIDFSELGIYSLGTKFAGLINVFVLQSFQLGFLPIAFKIYKQPDAKKFFAKVMTYMVLILSLTSLVISMFSKEVIVLASSKNPDFWRASVLIPILCAGFVFKGIQYMLAINLHFVKKTYINAIVVISSALLNVGLNFIFIPAYGIFGAALSTLIAYVFMCIAFYYYAQKNFRIKYEAFRAFLVVTTATGIFLISHFFFSELSLLNALLKLALILIYPILLYWMGFYHKVEIERITQFWAKWGKISELKGNIRSLSKADDAFLSDVD